MPPKKKKAGGGDPAKGERIFKNLCSACHALSVRIFRHRLNEFRPIQLVLLLEVSAVSISPQDKVSTTLLPWLLRLH